MTLTALLSIRLFLSHKTSSQQPPLLQGKVVSDEKRAEPDDDDAIEGKGLGGSIRIPVRRTDVGPYIKWVVISIAFGVAVLCIGGAVRLVLGGL